MRWFLAVMMPWLLLPLPAVAETNDWCRMHGMSCEPERETRVYAWRKYENPKPRKHRVERDREREREREDRREAREFGFMPSVPSRHALCLAPVSVVGSQHVTENGAEESAVKGWAEQVRFAHGEQFMAIEGARDYAKRCTRSSIGELAGAMLHRCQVVARPCRPALELKEDGK